MAMGQVTIVGNEFTRGCYLIEPDMALLDGLDGLLANE